MTEKNELEGQSRRTFLKTTGAVGVAATGIGAFAGTAAAQQKLVADTLDVTRQTGGDVNASGLITVVAQNVDLTALNNVQVEILNIDGDVLSDITVQNIDILNDNVVKVNIGSVDLLNVVGNQIIVNALGFTDADQTDQLFNLSDRVQVSQ